MTTIRRLSAFIALLGVWQILAPFIWGYSEFEIPLWNDLAVGAALLVLGIWNAVSRNLETMRWLSWITAAIGVWLIIAPFLLGYIEANAAGWNDIVVGVLVSAAAVWAALTVPTIETLQREDVDVD